MADTCLKNCDNNQNEDTRHKNANPHEAYCYLTCTKSTQKISCALIYPMIIKDHTPLFIKKFITCTLFGLIGLLEVPFCTLFLSASKSFLQGLYLDRSVEGDL